MKICMISDTHNYHNSVELEPGDVLIHAGDFTSMGKKHEIESFNRWIKCVPYKHKIVVPGNHDIMFEEDWNKAIKLLRDATVLNQQTVEIEGLKIYGEPRQPWFYDWAFNVPRNKMKDVWDKVPHNTDILVTHGPPFKCGDKLLTGEEVGCAYLSRWIEQYQPKLVVVGHIHPGYGMHHIGDTTVVNAAICTDHYKPTNKPIYLDV